MIVYDVTNPGSFEQLKDWIQEVQNNTPKTSRIIIIGNKIDLLDGRVENAENRDEVSYE